MPAEHLGSSNKTIQCGVGGALNRQVNTKEIQKLQECLQTSQQTQQ